MKNALFVFLAILILGYFFGKKAYNMLNNAIVISSLNPIIQQRVRNMVQNLYANHGIRIKVYSGYRSFKEQNELYKKGREYPGKVVTNANPGESLHNYGLAFDVVPIVDGVAIWDNDMFWNTIAAVGKSYGFIWGGDWKTFVDKPHFQDSFGLTIAELKKERETQNKDLISLV
jgi:peptidoglycan L-alanyl-D-glutamate endopeptidase CwlK